MKVNHRNNSFSGSKIFAGGTPEGVYRCQNSKYHQHRLVVIKSSTKTYVMIYENNMLSPANEVWESEDYEHLPNAVINFSIDDC